LIKYDYNLFIHNLCRYGKTAQKGKIPENLRLGTGTQMSYQIFGRIPAWRRGISGKTPVCEQEH
jgi:hypothetical protein